MDEQIFSENPDESLFEQAAFRNGETYWLASQLMAWLGYENESSFRKAISKAQVACGNLEIPAEDNFVRVTNSDGMPDTRLTRTACYFIVMSADVSKPAVARAQAYFVSMAESIRRYWEEAERVQRIHLRGEVTLREKSLAGVARDAQVTVYALFQNAGYRGMYNLNLTQLRTQRAIGQDRSPLDFMGPTELAANLFRITQTEEKIRKERIVGQRSAEDAAESVGKEVRATMLRTSGTLPEELSIAEDNKEVKKQVKHTTKRLKQIDSLRKKKKK